MRFRRTLAFWLPLALCAATVLGAMTWLTRSVLAAERERLTAYRDRAAAEARADLEERTRLALWRMDALGAAIVLRENLVPADRYQASAPAAEVPPAEPEVLLHFQLGNNSELLSPEAGAADSATREAAAERLKRLRVLWAANPPNGDEWSLLAQTPKISLSAPAPQIPQPQSLDNAFQRETIPNDQLRKDAVYQQQSNVAERNQRARVVGQTVSSNQAQSGGLAANDAQPHPSKEVIKDGPLAMGMPALEEKKARPAATKAGKAQPAPAAAPAAPARRNLTEAELADQAEPAPNPPILPAVLSQKVETGQMRTTWLGGELFLIRKTTSRIPNQSSHGEFDRFVSTTFIQGVWLDSRILTTTLLREVADLLPRARLLPAVDQLTAADPLALVSFPFKLERGETPLATAISTTPGLGAPLWVAWGAVALAFLASALLVRGVLRLSERRASFVSAVTHELRTPLTTFRLYSDMLEQGAVKEEKRGGYLRVLAREADRLSHLVENVLAFSRMERGNARSNLRETGVDEMLGAFHERFTARLATASLDLTIHPAPDLRLRADLAAVEHILFNLIDNAAKYAA
ncbi:MAG: HAMP domain-containing histidine kinase, partial [Akkermansiaceae bacterium]|nr:HAMP domain-containing histidine kinase [Akkermansiaceae bacterium]